MVNLHIYTSELISVLLFVFIVLRGTTLICTQLGKLGTYECCAGKPSFPLLGLTPSGLFMGSICNLIYTSELILCSTICVHSATRHNIHIA